MSPPLTKFSKLYHRKVVSSLNAPARRNSSLVITQYMRWGVTVHPGGRDIDVRRMNSLPEGGGNSDIVLWWVLDDSVGVDGVANGFSSSIRCEA